jgi:hypothetical protein
VGVIATGSLVEEGDTIVGIAVEIGVGATGAAHAIKKIAQRTKKSEQNRIMPV